MQQLLQTIAFDNVAAGAQPTATIDLNLNQNLPVLPDLIAFDNPAFDYVSLVGGVLTVINKGSEAQNGNAYLLYFHTVQRSFGNVATKQGTPAPFVIRGAGGASSVGMAVVVTAAALQALPGPTAAQSQATWVDEFAAVYRWVAGSVVVADGFRVIGHTGGVAGRWILDGDEIHLAPSRGATWAQLVAARAAMAYKGTVVCAAEPWTFDVADVGVTNCPNGTHEIWMDGATINGTVALSPGTIAQNGFWYNNGGTTAPIASTTLNGNVAAGATQIVVTSAVGFVVNGWFRIQRGVAYTRTYRITAIAGATITLDRPLLRPFNNGDTIEVITAARDITIEGNGVTVTGQADAIWQVASSNNCHFLDIKGRLTTAKFNCCFDLGSRDSTANNCDVNGNGAIPSSFLVHNTENIRLYDCVGDNVGGAGTPTVLSLASNDNFHDYTGYYTRGTNICVLDVEDLTDTFGCRGSTFKGSYFAGATAGVGVLVQNGSSDNTFIGIECAFNQTGISFAAGAQPPIGNVIDGGVLRNNSQVGLFAANGNNKAVGVSFRDNDQSDTYTSGGAILVVSACTSVDTSAAVPGQGINYCTGAGSRLILSGVRCSSTRNAHHFVEVAGNGHVEINGGTSFQGAAANQAGLLMNGPSTAKVDDFTVTSAGGFGLFLNNAAAYCRVGSNVDVSVTGTPFQISAGALNRGQIALTAAVAVAVAFGDTNAQDRLFWSYVTNVGATGVVITGAPVVGTGFNIVGLAGDTSVINYEIR